MKLRQQRERCPHSWWRSISLERTLSWIRLGLRIGLVERQRWNWEVKEGKLLELEVRIDLCLGFRDHGFGSNRAFSCFTAFLLREWWVGLCITSFTSSPLEYGLYLPSSSSSLCQGVYFILWCKCRYICACIHADMCMMCSHKSLKFEAAGNKTWHSCIKLHVETSNCYMWLNICLSLAMLFGFGILLTVSVFVLVGSSCSTALQLGLRISLCLDGLEDTRHWRAWYSIFRRALQYVKVVIITIMDYLSYTVNAHQNATLF